MPHRNRPLNKIFQSSQHALQTLVEILGAASGVVAIDYSGDNVVITTAARMEEYLRFQFHMLGYPAELTVEGVDLIENSHENTFRFEVTFNALVISQREVEDCYKVTAADKMSWTTKVRDQEQKLVFVDRNRIRVPFGTVAEDLLPDLVMLAKGHFREQVDGHAYTAVAMALYHHHYGLGRDESFAWPHVRDFLEVVLRLYAENDVVLSTREIIKLIDLGRQERIEEVVGEVLGKLATMPVIRIDEQPMFWVPNPETIQFLNKRYV